MSQYQQVKTHRQRALILLPLLSLSLFFLSWELIVDMGLVPQTLLASPSAVVELFFAKLTNASPDGMLLQEHAWISIKAVSYTHLIRSGQNGHGGAAQQQKKKQGNTVAHSVLPN